MGFSHFQEHIKLHHLKNNDGSNTAAIQDQVIASHCNTEKVALDIEYWAISSGFLT